MDKIVVSYRMSSNPSPKPVLSNEQQKALNNARKRREALRNFQRETQHASIKKLMNEGGRRSRRTRKQHKRRTHCRR